MIYIIDFDDTLFDKSGAFAQACSQIGIEFRGPLYQKAKGKNGIYNPRKHLKLLAKPYSSLEKIIAQSQKFLFPQTVQKLRKLSKKHKLILLSKGDLYFQKAKIRHSGIEKFFSNIYITNKSKVEVIEEKILPQYPQENIVFVDNKKEEREAVKAIFPKIKTKSRL